jgi:hypothetical protein
VRRLLTSLIAATTVAIVIGVPPASAHENRPVGPLQFTVGWADEPAFTGYKNSVTLRISRGGQPVGGVTGIKAQAKTGDETVELTLHPAVGEPGLYEAPLIPTRTGTYTFTFSGTVAGEEFSEAFTSGEGTFDSPTSASEVAFPVKDPSTGDLAQRLERETKRLAAAQAAGEDAKDEAAQAKTFAMVGIAVGALGLIVGGVALTRKR